MRGRLGRVQQWIALVTAGLWLAAIGLGAPVPQASAQPAGGAHGMGFAKGCASPVNVGQPYACFYVLTNTIDQERIQILFFSA